MVRMSRITKLPRRFYERKAVTVARDLLGKHLVHVHEGVERRGRIVEVEAYLGAHDLAAHSAKGLTPRTKTMFGPPGHAYVYLIYGIHQCMNVVCEPKGHPAAVLLRALEPVGHLERARGPGLLCSAMRIDRKHDGHDLLSESLFLDDPRETRSVTIVRRPRIGVDYAGEWANKLLRFYIKDNPYVSRP
jgi:DNA-3-methyladenine glycosylase